MISVEEALRRILERTRPLATETVSLGEARGRVLREDVFADRDLPPFNRSAVDGYAVRAACLANGGRLRVVDQVPAGAMPRVPVGPGEAAAVMTGAPIPEGADSAIMVEDTVLDGDFVVWPAPGRSPPPVEPGNRVTARGAEVRQGAKLLEAGARVSPAGVGLLATVGKARVAVARRPRAAVFSTGDELRHPRSAKLRPAQIRDANSHMIAARCRALGLPVRRLGFAADDPGHLAATIRSGLAADVLFISGGVSMGRYDYVEPVLERAGVRLLVTAVAIRPGKPFVFGIREGSRPVSVFGLPGNPVSALTTFEVFARPALDALQGIADPRPPRPSVRLLAPVSQRGPRRAFLPARVGLAEDGALTAQPIRSQGSGDIAAVALANALVIVPEHAGTIPAGDSVEAQPLPGFPDAGAGWHDPRR